MFEPVESSVEAGKRFATLFVSILLHAAVIAILVIVPLIYYNVLPTPEVIAFLSEPPPPPAPPPPAPPKAVFHKVEHITKFVAPTEIPKTIPPPTEMPSAVDEDVVQGVPGGVQGGVVGGVPDGVIGGIVHVRMPVRRLPPPPPPPPKPKTHGPIRVGGNVEAGKLIYSVNPSYPALATEARVQGVVVLEVTVDAQGNVESVKVLSGHPLLREAAVQAVKQWRYKPTHLNGEAVPVIADVTVRFNLGEGAL